MKATKLDILFGAVAVGLTVLLLGTRLFNYMQLQSDADEMYRNLQSISTAVHEFKAQTGEWFPEATSASAMFSFPDPFNFPRVSDQYQGLEDQWFSTENNHNMIVQLVRFDSERANRVTRHLFQHALSDGEPFIRILLPYGNETTTDTRILLMLQDQLPPQSLAEVDDHYFVLDLRQLNDV